jgi:hypothetical protein
MEEDDERRRCLRRPVVRQEELRWKGTGARKLRESPNVAVRGQLGRASGVEQEVESRKQEQRRRQISEEHPSVLDGQYLSELERHCGGTLAREATSAKRDEKGRGSPQNERCARSPPFGVLLPAL